MQKRLLALVLIVIASACTTSGVGGDSDTGLIRAHSGRGEGGMAAIVQGTVEVDVEVGCVWLSTADGARHPVIWPSGTEAEGDPLLITLSNGETVGDGDLVSGGGGYVSAASATQGMEPFPEQCIQDGQAAVFNAGSDVQVIPGGGSEATSTLVDRFSVPESIGLELIAVNPNRRSVAVADFVSGTVHLYESSDYESPPDAIDGASGGGGFIHLWSQGTVYSYPGRLTDDPLVYQPEHLREVEGVTPILEVLPAPNGEHTWLVQDGAGFGPTRIELVNLVEVQLARQFSIEVEGSWQPFGTTTAGLVLVSNEGAPRTLLVGMDGSIGEAVPGIPLSVGWSGAVIVEDGGLRVTAPDLTQPIEVDQPVPGSWASVGGPVILSSAPPLRTGAASHLVSIVDGQGPASGVLVVVRDDGSTRVIHEIEGVQGIGMFARADDWVVFVEPEAVTLIPSDGESIELGEIIPSEHWVLAGG